LGAARDLVEFVLPGFEFGFPFVDSGFFFADLLLFLEYGFARYLVSDI
jgi:hypothetical protein